VIIKPKAELSRKVVDQTDEARPTREAGDTSVEVGFKMASRVTSRESRMIPEESMPSIPSMESSQSSVKRFDQVDQEVEPGISHGQFCAAIEISFE
jgi:hypothetical protein